MHAQRRQRCMLPSMTSHLNTRQVSLLIASDMIYDWFNNIWIEVASSKWHVPTCMSSAQQARLNWGGLLATISRCQRCSKTPKGSISRPSLPLHRDILPPQPQPAIPSSVATDTPSIHPPSLLPSHVCPFISASPSSYQRWFACFKSVACDFMSGSNFLDGNELR